jgi:Ni,Fe-hydrogenase III large subunit
VSTASTEGVAPAAGGSPFLRTRNGRVVRRADVPVSSVEVFRAALLGRISAGARLVALFGARPRAEEAGPGDAVELWAVLADDHAGALELAVTRVTSGSYPSLTPECPQAHLFERELHELWGITPVGHPWLKPVRFVRTASAGTGTGTGTGTGGEGGRPTVGVMDYYRVEGAEIHEVGVGPVHAGVIEPGHFRFQCHGEHVFHLEISLGYQHRGVERALLGGPTKRTIHHMETLAGDTSVGHASAYCQLVEALAGARVPGRALALRGVALELERMANHTGDLGALANDVGFLPTASYCGRLRGDFLNLTAAICGSRFGRSLVRPGGVGFDVDAERAADLVRRLDAAVADVENAADLLWSAASVLSRFENTGVVTEETALDLGLVGFAARASGVYRDVRHDHPSGIFRFTKVPVSTVRSGDVFARAYVRWLEVRRSARVTRELLLTLPRGATLARHGELAPDSVCVSMIEGWRGEIAHVALTDARGKFAAYKVVDPSFHNWAGLAMAMRDTEISDFPICNKSFDLSYCGHDL